MNSWGWVRGNHTNSCGYRGDTHEFMWVRTRKDTRIHGRGERRFRARLPASGLRCCGPVDGVIHMRWTLLARHTCLAALAASALLVQGSPALAATPSTAPARVPAAAVPAAAPVPVAPTPARHRRRLRHRGRHCPPRGPRLLPHPRLQPRPRWFRRLRRWGRWQRWAHPRGRSPRTRMARRR